MIDISSKYCTGCEACAAACPKKCISFKRDQEGFNVPTINTNECIKCGKCMRVCSATSDCITGVADKEQSAVAAITKDVKIWKKSTSGGAFTEICKAIYQIAGNEEIVFCGAMFAGLTVKHDCVTNINDISKFRKSKYVQSSIDGTFAKIKQVLDKGGYAVFAGTPCQVYGLRKFLKKSYDKLYCMDLICHGVGSPGVFEQSMKETEQRLGKKIKQYSFRHKSSGLFPKNRYTSLYVFEDGTKKQVTYDDYNRLFLSQVCLRKSCAGNCRFRNCDRQGDFTLADFNEKMLAFPELKDSRNYSTIVFNTEKARKLKEILKQSMHMYECELEHICKFNPLFCKTTEANINRNQFFDEFCDGREISKLATKYGANLPKGIRTIINLVPYRIKRVIYKGLGKI